MKYELNDKPGMIPMLMYGLQWFIVTVPSLVIIGIVAAGIHAENAADQIFYLQKMFIVMGLATVVQIMWGHKLPLVIGPASVLLIGVVAAESSGASATYTAIVVCGILLSVLAYSGLLYKLRFVFTPRVITVILIMIALTLSPVILNLIISDKSHAAFDLVFALILTLIFVVTNNLLKGVWKSTTIVLGMFVGSLIYYMVNGFPLSSLSDMAKIGFVGDSSFFAFSPEFNIGTILAFIFCFIALIINELGSIEAVAQMLKADGVDKRIKRGVGILGFSNVASGLFGIIGPVDFSMSAGIISATRCASRYTLIPAGLGLVVCAFFPPVISLLSSIPGVVLGCIMLYLMSSQFASGLNMLITEKAIANFNDALTVGLSLMIALIISYTPKELFTQFPAILHPIIGNGFVMGVITVLVLEHIVFGKKELKEN